MGLKHGTSPNNPSWYALREWLVREAKLRDHDLDYIEIVPHDAMQVLQEIAGRESLLARKYRLYFQYVAVVSLPESYRERLTQLFPGRFRNLRMFALDPYDLALSKLTRNSPVDRDDVAHLAKTVPLDPVLLRTRYQQELRPVVIGDPDTIGRWRCGSSLTSLHERDQPGALD